MREVLLELGSLPEYISESARVDLTEIYQEVGMNSTEPRKMRVQRLTNGKEILTTFAGSKINRTLYLMLKIRGSEKVDLNDNRTSISMVGLASELNQLLINPVSAQGMEEWLHNNPDLIRGLSSGGKYSMYLPEELLINAAIENMLDIEATNKWINTIELEFTK